MSIRDLLAVSAEDHARLTARVAAARDREAFAALYDHFAPRLVGWLVRTGSTRGVAEEITQEVMTTLWTKARLFDPAKSSLATWLFRVARNRRIDLVRRDRSGEIDLDDPFFDVEPEASAEAGMEARQRETQVAAALEALPEEQKSMIRLAFFDELSHSEIADRTGLPLGTVKSRIRLAFARLRDRLDDLGR